MNNYYLPAGGSFNIVHAGTTLQKWQLQSINVQYQLPFLIKCCPMQPCSKIVSMYRIAEVLGQGSKLMDLQSSISVSNKETESYDRVNTRLKQTDNTAVHTIDYRLLTMALYKEHRNTQPAVQGYYMVYHDQLCTRLHNQSIEVQYAQ